MYPQSLRSLSSGINQRFIPVSLLTLALAATGSAVTYTYSGGQNGMNQGQAPVATYDTVDFNITSGYFGTGGARSQTYANPNIIVTNMTMNNGWGEAVTTFSAATTFTGAGNIALAGAGLGQDFVFAGNMQGYTGAISMGNFGDATLTLGSTASNVVQFGGTTAGGTVALGTVTNDGSSNLIDNVNGTGAFSGNNLVFNYGTDAGYDYLKVNNTIAVRDSLAFLGNANITTTAAISGTGALIKEGTGTVTLNAQNTYTGGTTINAGTLDLADGGGAAGTIRGTATVNSGATLQLSTGDATGWAGGANALTTINLVGGTLHVNTTSNQTLGSATINMTGGSITGIAGSNLDFFGNGSVLNTLASSTTSTISMPSIQLRQNDTVFNVEDGAAATDLLISSVIGNGPQGNHNMVKSGAGTMVLSGNNTFAGNVAINDGVLQLGASGGGNGSNGVLGNSNTATSKVSVASGATLDINGFADTNYGITIAGTGTTGQGALVNTGDSTGNNLIQTPYIALSANASIGGTGDFYMIAQGYGANDLTLNGHTLTKTGSNTFSLTNTTVTSGTIQIAQGTLSQFRASNASAASIALSDVAGASLNLNNLNLAVGSLSGGGTTGGNVNLGSATLTVGAINANTSYAGAIGGSGSVVKTGTGTQTLTGANTYTGNTTINNGVVDLTSTGSKLYSAGFNNTAVVTVNTNATLKLDGFNYGGSLGNLADYAQRRVIDGGIIEVTGGTHSSGNNFTVASNGGTFRYNPATSSDTLTLGGNGNSNIVLDGALTMQADGNIVVDEVMQGTGSLTKTGTGTQTLTGANTYTGDTTVSAGTLALSGTGSIASSPIIDIASGATVDVSGLSSTFELGDGQTLTGKGTVVGPIQAALGSTIAPGASPGTLHFDDDLTVAGGAVMMIEITGLTPCTEFDVIQGDGANTLTINGGTLDLDTTGYTATAGDSFVIFENWGSIAGSGFDTINGTDLGGVLSFDTSDLYNSGTLTVVAIPEPSSAALLGLGAFALVLRRRK